MFKNMTKTQKILFYIVIVIILLVVLGVGLFYWKKNKDIKDMKTSIFNSLALACTTDANRQKTADCIVNKLLQEYGYLQTKEKFFEGDNKNTTTDEDKTKLEGFTATCITQICPIV